MRRRAPAILLLAALCALGFLLRTGNAASVFVGDAVVFAENDPYYHMRRVFQILAHFPRVPWTDPWIDPPHGAPVVFAPLLDFAIAAAAKLLGLGVADRREVETLAALVPPLLGALTCLPVFWLAAQTTSTRAALLAATLTALLPAHIWYARLGFVDHHVAATFLFVATCALVLRAVGVGRTAGGTSAPEAPDGTRPPDAPDGTRAADRTSASDRMEAPDGTRVPVAARASHVSAAPDAAEAHPPARAGWFTAAGAVALAAGVLVWNGFLLLAAVLDAWLVLAFATSGPARRVWIARVTARVHLGAALLVLPVAVAAAAAGGPSFGVVTISLLHPALLASFGLCAAVAAWGLARAPAPLRRSRVLAAALGAAGVAAILWRGPLEALGGTLGWVLASDPFMSSVQESVSILRTADGRLDLAGPQVWMTRFFLATPFLLALLAVRLARERFADAGRSFVLVWATALFLLTLRQRRFGETFAPALAVLVADFLVGAAAWTRTRLAARGHRPALARGVAGAMVAALVLLAVAPYHAALLASPGRLTTLLRAPIAALGRPDRFTEADRAEQEASDDVRLHRALGRLGALPETPDGAASNAVMNPWPLGHKLLYVASVPVTATPFGSYVGGSGFEDSTDFYLASDERRALEILARRGTDRVVVDNDLGTIGASIVARGENPRSYYGKTVGDEGTTYHFLPPLVRTLYLRLTRFFGAEVKLATADGASETVPALDRFRLVLDSGNDDVPGFPKVWEVVRGARLRVRATPGAIVTLRYAYTSDAGRPRVHEKTAVAGAHGEATAILPYSSERPDLGQTAAWTVASGDRKRTVHVAEADVREGRGLAVALD